MPRKRANMLIFQYLTPWELIFKISLVCKNFYILCWEKEVSKPVLENCLGVQKLKELRYKINKMFLADEGIPSYMKGDPIDVSSSSSEDYSDASGHNVDLNSSTSSNEETLINKRIKNFEPRKQKRERIEYK